MSPEFLAGDYLLLRICRRPKEGDLVVYRHPHYGDIFKRVASLEVDSFLLTSDNPKGINSTQIGPCQNSLLQGKLLWHIKQNQA